VVARGVAAQSARLLAREAGFRPVGNVRPMQVGLIFSNAIDPVRRRDEL
jgi:hypothetical protein